MAFKQFALDDGTPVTIYKRKASRSIRLSISSKGEVRLSIPTWTPYVAGLHFAKSKANWIAEQKQPEHILLNDQQVGKAHRLKLLASDGTKKVTSRVINGTIFIKYPAHLPAADPSVQAVAKTASTRALRAQAEQLLPQRLATLADQHGFTYTDVAIKQLRSRWGSCDSKRHIVLNLYLMQLPWDLIDYVLLHELTHTQELHHGPKFWETMRRITPKLATRRKLMRMHQPVLYGSK